MNILRFFKAIGRGIARALQFAEARGLTDELVDLALSHVSKAQVRFLNSTDRREWVVAELMKDRVPESVARLAVELAVSAFKQKIGG